MCFVLKFLKCSSVTWELRATTQPMLDSELDFQKSFDCEAQNFLNTN